MVPQGAAPSPPNGNLEELKGAGGKGCSQFRIPDDDLHLPSENIDFHGVEPAEIGYPTHFLTFRPILFVKYSAIFFDYVSFYEIQIRNNVNIIFSSSLTQTRW